MKKNLKIGTALLAAALVLGAMTGCSGGDASGFHHSGGGFRQQRRRTAAIPLIPHKRGGLRYFR